MQNNSTTTLHAHKKNVKFHIHVDSSTIKKYVYFQF